MILPAHRWISFLFWIVAGYTAKGQTSNYLVKALETEKWIASNRLVTSHGHYWRVTPEDSVPVTNLYSGSAGVVLFYLELFNATHEQRFLEEARKGADYLAYRSGKDTFNFDEIGLFTGEAGICFVLGKVYDLTKEDHYKKAQLNSFQKLISKTSASQPYADWRYNDIVYGGAGIGLLLLHRGDLPGATELATKTGNQLLRSAIATSGGKKWYMDTSFVRQGYYMPNFSHGTAGVSYFLSSLYQKTKEKKFLTAAIEGAKHLSAIQNHDAWIYHDDRREGKDIYYLSWCHGPAGTARLYYKLYQITGDKAWLEKIKQAAVAMMKCGIPQKQTSGFWNNVGPCCGSAGIAQFFYSLSIILNEKIYLDFSDMITDDLIQRGTLSDKGFYWIQAEHRRRPELLQAQTGYMQGAAGVGTWLLYRHAYSIGKKPFIMLPDDPFK